MAAINLNTYNTEAKISKISKISVARNTGIASTTSSGSSNTHTHTNNKNKSPPPRVRDKSPRQMQTANAAVAVYTTPTAPAADAPGSSASISASASRLPSQRAKLAKQQVLEKQAQMSRDKKYVENDEYCMFRCLGLWLFVDYSILLLLYSISSGALGSPDLLLSYYIINNTISSLTTKILMTTHLSTNKSINPLINTGTWTMTN